LLPYISKALEAGIKDVLAFQQRLDCRKDIQTFSLLHHCPAGSTKRRIQTEYPQGWLVDKDPKVRTLINQLVDVFSELIKMNDQVLSEIGSTGPPSLLDAEAPTTLSGPSSSAPNPETLSNPLPSILKPNEDHQATKKNKMKTPIPGWCQYGPCNPGDSFPRLNPIPDSYRVSHLSSALSSYLYAILGELFHLSSNL
jgi:hypothetical protein